MGPAHTETLPAREPHAPFYAGVDGNAGTSRRLLLLSYHFPPAQTAGALRWQKLAHYADRRGYGLDVVTLDPTAAGIRDPDSLADLPSSIRVFGVAPRITIFDRVERAVARARRWGSQLRAHSPRSAAHSPAVGQQSSFARSELRFDPTSLRSWVRAYDGVAVPSKELDWAVRAAELGRRITVPGVHRAVVSCGPPHMAHEGARRLARTTGLPLVLDFRDPWSLVERLVEHFASPTYLRFVGRYEARAVAQASLVVMNTELARIAMQQRFPGVADRIIAVMNGCDEGTVARSYRPSDPFRIAYAGSIYLDRSPTTLFRALARVIEELSLTPAQIEAAFMGAVSQQDGRSLESEAAAAGVGAYVRSLPLGTRRAAEQFLASAHLLVNLYQDSRMAIPSKIFEYMRHEAALLVLAEPDSAPYQLVRGTEVALAAPDDVAAIAAAIRSQYERHRAGEPIAAMASDPRFSRRRQAELLFDAIERIS